MKSRLARIRGVVILITFCLPAAACGPSAERQAAGTALDSLQKINAALKVRVSYQDYGKLVTEAQAQVDKASSLLPDGELKNELNVAMEAHREAKWAWEVSKQVSQVGGRDVFILAAEYQDLKTLSFDRRNATRARELLKKYSLTVLST